MLLSLKLYNIVDIKIKTQDQRQCLLIKYTLLWIHLIHNRDALSKTTNNHLISKINKVRKVTLSSIPNCKLARITSLFPWIILALKTGTHAHTRSNQESMYRKSNCINMEVNNIGWNNSIIFTTVNMINFNTVYNKIKNITITEPQKATFMYSPQSI